MTDSYSLAPYIHKLFASQELTEEEISAIFDIMISGHADPVQVGAFLTVLHKKEETANEIYGFAKALQEHAVNIYPKVKEPLIDTCGTGGDGLNTFNVSTTSMFIIAGAGVPVAKHGNCGITSKCGSSDVLTALGIDIKSDPIQVCESIEKVGIGFMYAPLYHPTMKYIAPIRKSLPFRTVFNILGPLCNPAKAQRQILGTFLPEVIPLLAEALVKLGTEHALVFSGYIPELNRYMDEISPFGPTQISEIRNGKVITSYKIDPSEFDLPPFTLESIRGFEPEQNAMLVEKILRNRLQSPLCDLIKLNAAAGLYIAGRAPDIPSGFKLAGEILESGKAYDVLEQWRKICPSKK